MNLSIVAAIVLLTTMDHESVWRTPAESVKLEPVSWFMVFQLFVKLAQSEKS